MRTYENVGIVYVSVCDHNVEVMQGLWEDWKEQRVSYVQIMEAFVKHEECEKDTDELMQVELKFVSSGVDESITEGGQEHFKVIAAMACYVSYPK